MHHLPKVQTDLLSLLHSQHHSYTTELGSTHRALSKLYKKLARVERALVERQERGLNRQDKKKLYWTRSVAKSTVEILELQQASLQEYLRQCNDLIASYEQQSTYHLPATPWTAHLPSSPYAAAFSPHEPFSPYSPIASNPWTAELPSRPCREDQSVQRPQYWDLSMLRERRQSSPNASSAADSGFCEPVMYAQPFGFEGFSDPDHVYAHELMSVSTYSSGSEAPTLSERSKKSSLSEGDRVSELFASSLSFAAKAGAKMAARPGTHRRRYSENAVQLTASRPAVQDKSWQRGMSVGLVSGVSRQRIEDLEVGDRRM